MIKTYTLIIRMPVGCCDHKRFTGLSRVAVSRYLDYYRTRDEYRGHTLTSD